MPALVVSAVALMHGVMLARSLVIVSVVPGVIFDGVFRTGPVEGPSHARPSVAFIELPMTCGARRWLDVACVFACDEKRLGSSARLEQEAGDCQGGDKEGGQASHSAYSSLFQKS